MPLVDLWKKDRKQLEPKKVEQIIGFAGEGRLKDDSEASRDFRDFLTVIPSDTIRAYATDCVESPFDDSGLALQDIVNEMGRRLGFTVEHGRYRGLKNVNGYDGLWRLPAEHAIVVEVKTTSAYQVHLETIVKYRKDLIRDGLISEQNSSILIVVGREDTGDLEAQIRGSRHAWDMRLISVDALIRLMLLKENVEEPQTIRKIYDLLIPREFTKLDGIVEIVFSTAEEVKEDEEPIDPDLDKRATKFTPVSFHQACVDRIEAHLKCSLLKRTKSCYSSPDESLALVCAVSREHSRERGFWFAFHPHQGERLSKAATGYVAFGCGSRDTIVLIPWKDFSGWLQGRHQTHVAGRYYWHIRILRVGKTLTLLGKKDAKKIDLTSYILPPK